MPALSLFEESRQQLSRAGGFVSGGPKKKDNCCSCATQPGDSERYRTVEITDICSIVKRIRIELHITEEKQAHAHESEEYRRKQLPSRHCAHARNDEVIAVPGWAEQATQQIHEQHPEEIKLVEALTGRGWLQPELSATAVRRASASE